MKTFHNDPAVKQKYIDRIKAHREADHLIQGISWDNGKGCAVGCTLENYDHKQYEIELGIPECLAHLEDHIFENLPKCDAMNWPEQFLEAIPLGINETECRKTVDQFQIFCLERRKTQFDTAIYPQVLGAIERVINLLKQAINGDEPDQTLWRAAWSAAARAGARAVASAVASAAASAAASTAARAAWSAAAGATWIESIIKRDWLLKTLQQMQNK